jgi:hypothetical protein
MDTTGGYAAESTASVEARASHGTLLRYVVLCTVLCFAERLQGDARLPTSKSELSPAPLVPAALLRAILEDLKHELGAVATVALELFELDPEAFERELERIAANESEALGILDVKADLLRLLRIRGTAQTVSSQRWRRLLALDQVEALSRKHTEPPGEESATPTSSSVPDTLVQTVLSLRQRYSVLHWLRVLQRDLEQQMDLVSLGNAACTMTSREFDQQVYIHWRFSPDSELVYPSYADLQLTANGNLVGTADTVLVARIQRRSFPLDRVGARGVEASVPAPAATELVDVLDVRLPACLRTAYRSWQPVVETLESAVLRAIGTHWGWRLRWEPAYRRCLDGHRTAFHRGLLRHVSPGVSGDSLSIHAVEEGVFQAGTPTCSETVLLRLRLDGTLVPLRAASAPTTLSLRVPLGGSVENQRHERRLVEEI